MSPRSSRNKRIDAIVGHFETNNEWVRRFLAQVESFVAESDGLKPLVHSVRTRIKDSAHLREKLIRKGLAANVGGKRVEITTANLFTTVTDLAGIRLLHLYQSQFFDIDRVLKEIIKHEQLSLLEGPIAKTWDDDTRSVFRSRKIDVATEESMYTSVHYVVGSGSETMVTCEIQVRTLIEETWGELSHSLNYPTPAPDPMCANELKVLARIGSSAVSMIECIQARASLARLANSTMSGIGGRKQSGNSRSKRS